MNTTDAIKQHGAKAVYQAACRALEGDNQPLAELGFSASRLSDAWHIQSQAYRRLTPGERAAEQMLVNAALMQQERKP